MLIVMYCIDYILYTLSNASEYPLLGKVVPEIKKKKKKKKNKKKTNKTKTKNLFS